MTQKQNQPQYNEAFYAGYAFQKEAEDKAEQKEKSKSSK